MMKRLETRELNVLGASIGFLTAVMIFFTALVSNDSERLVTGLNVAFGHEFANFGTYASVQMQLSVFNILAYLLPLVASMIFLFRKKNRALPIPIFALSTVLLMLVPQTTVTTVTILGNTNQLNIDWSYGIGLILAILFSFSGFCFSLIRIYKNKF